MTLNTDIEWSPEQYKKTAIVAEEAGIEMLERLSWMTLKPKMVIDMGCGTGEFCQQLQNCYPEATIVGVDFTPGMLTSAEKAFPKLSFTLADVQRVPYPAATVDLICANMIIPWQKNLAALFTEWWRLLKPNGLLMVSVLGPDSLGQLNEKLAADIIPQLMDMHDIGDLLVQQGFADPVLDVCYYTLTYTSAERMAEELVSSGMVQRSAELVSILQTLPQNAEGQWEVTFEVIQGHAWREDQRQNSTGETFIPVGNIKR